MSNRLSPQLFAILRPLIEDAVGIHYGPGDLDLFSDKIHGRMREAGYESALDYYYRLRYDDPAGVELAALVESFVVGETYLFRELDAVVAAVETVIVPAIARNGKARIWSAACATGEEPMSIAIVLAQLGLLDRVVIMATDLSSRALAQAEAGRYTSRSLRAVERAAEGSRVAKLAARGLIREDNFATVRQEIRAAVTFGVQNLLDPPPPAFVLAPFDVVFCRNVLIYFSDATVGKVVRNLTTTLAPGGRLVVGTSESLLRFGTELRCEERSGAFFYAKEGA